MAKEGTEPADPILDRRAPRPDPEPGIRRLGLIWSLVSLGILFASCLIGFLIVRFSKDEWRGADTPALPWTLWLVTLSLLLCSVFLEQASRAAAEARPFLRELWCALWASLAFFVLQIASWVLLTLAQMPPTAKDLYGFTFYVLTSVHFLHVVGGLVCLLWVLHRARQGAYDQGRSLGLRECTIYWHFLLGVWVVLFACLELAS